MTHKPLIVSLGLYKASGGPVKTISKFREALDSELYCFVNKRQYRQEAFGVDGANVIQSPDLPLLREMCYAPGSALQDLESAARDASIISAHSFYRYHTLWVHKMFGRWKTPYWHVPHGILDPYVLSYGKVEKQLYLRAGGRAFLENAACTIFATPREQEKAESIFGPMRGEVVHWPVDLVDLSDRDTRRSVIRQRMGIAEDATVLLYFGRVQSMKRPLETIQAAARVKSDRLHLLMVGPLEGVAEVDLMDEARKAGFKNFHYAGGVYGQEKYDYLFASDAYVSFSVRENFNHTAAESMAAGLPVILSQGNDLGPLVAKAKSGWHLSEDSITALQTGIEDLLSMDSDSIQAMGRAGRDLVAQEFSFETFQSRLQCLANRYGRRS